MGAGADGAERLKREITDRMYGWEDGGACGSPAELTGNLRERLDASERRKVETESGLGKVQ